MNRKPLGLIFLAGVLVLFPFYVLVTLVFTYFSSGGSEGLFAYLLKVLVVERWDMLLILTAFVVVGIGLFRVRRWAFYSFIALGTLVVCLVVARTIMDASWNVPGVLLSMAMLVGGTYMLRRDLARPYLAVLPRGFRGSRRQAISFRVILKGLSSVSPSISPAIKDGVLEARTLDLSVGGCFLPMDDIPERIGDLPGADGELEVRLIFPDGDELTAPAWIARLIPAEGKRPSGLGIRFQADSRGKAMIRERIRTYYSPRYNICTEIKIITDTGDINGYTYNLSAQGAFVEQSDGDLPERDSRGLAVIHLERERVEIPVRVSWLNHNLVPEKPRGFGVEFASRGDISKSLRTYLRSHGKGVDVIR